ncbi:hypothetical protein D3C83_225250 [compost metagenome]
MNSPVLAACSHPNRMFIDHRSARSLYCTSAWTNRRVSNEYDTRVRSRFVLKSPHGRSTSLRW